jgi:zinc transport system ATP-binding protein
MNLKKAQCLVKTHNLNVAYGNSIILKEINIQVEQGKIVTLVGPNGAGKSTLVKSILGLINITSGSIKLAEDLTIGYMPQKLLVENLMPLPVINFLHLTGITAPNLIQSIADELEIGYLLSNPIQTISGGELQRVLLARALLRNPTLLVLDEPVQGVDVTGQNELYKLITNIRDRRNCGILMVSHDLHIVMAGTDSVVCLNKHVCCSGHPDTVSQHPEFVNLFGEQVAAGLAVYTHKHNHQHDLHGKIIDE